VQIIRKNFGLKLTAFALAVIGWAYFHYTHPELYPAKAPAGAVRATATPRSNETP
jgi:hypothetical protein